jgi:dienelactone hydrolase
MTHEAPPPFLQPFVHTHERVVTETRNDVDYYLPSSSERIGAVMLVHGGPIPEDREVGPRDWPAYVGYGSLLASSGVVAAMLEHRFRDLATLGRAIDDVRCCIDEVRGHPRVDPDRIAVWAFSAGGLLLGDLLSEQPPYLRAVAATYALMDVGQDAVVSSPTPVAVARRRAIAVPMLLVRVEHERNWIAATQDAFLQAMSDRDLATDVLEVAYAEHGFETIDDTDESRRAIDASVAWVTARLAKSTPGERGSAS